MSLPNSSGLYEKHALTCLLQASNYGSCRASRLLYVSPAGAALAMKLAGLQTERISRVLDELGPGSRESARRFLAGMIDAEDRDRVLRLIAAADHGRAKGKDEAS